MTDGKTAGQISIELKEKAPETLSPIEIQREAQKEYMAELVKCVQDGSKVREGVFYVVVVTKQERLMDNIFRNFFFHRQSCPTPEWDQAVYMYNPSEESLRFMWVIPSKDTCDQFMRDASMVTPEERDLLQYVIDYNNGTLFKVAKKLNGEESDSPLLVQ